MNVDGSNQTRVTNVGGGQTCYFPTWSPDSKELLYSFHDGSQSDIYKINVDGTGIQT